jgi:hypothetical protein
MIGAAGTPGVTGQLVYANAQSLPGSVNDVTTGSNGFCLGSYLCTAGPGYDAPTGVGTPNGLGLFEAP